MGLQFILVIPVFFSELHGITVYSGYSSFFRVTWDYSLFWLFLFFQGYTWDYSLFWLFLFFQGYIGLQFILVIPVFSGLHVITVYSGYSCFFRVTWDYSLFWLFLFFQGYMGLQFILVIPVFFRVTWDYSNEFKLIYADFTIMKYIFLMEKSNKNQL